MRVSRPFGVGTSVHGPIISGGSRLEMLTLVQLVRYRFCGRFRSLANEGSEWKQLDLQSPAWGAHTGATSTSTTIPTKADVEDVYRRSISCIL